MRKIFISFVHFLYNIRPNFRRFLNSIYESYMKDLYDYYDDYNCETHHKETSAR